MRRLIFIFSISIFIFTSCESERPSVPRPYSYHRIEFPARSYNSFNQDYCPISFEFPLRSQINKKKFFFNEDPIHDCWFNLSLEDLDATIYFTYQPIENSNSFEKLVDDAFTMASKHNPKANSREESKLKNNDGLEGVLFEIGGPVASPIQYYLTDGTNHFIRASLYYNKSSANDSLKIVTDYIKKDLMHIISTSSFL